MAQINCPECKHLMSNQAKVCPNCFAPRKVANMKICSNCGQEIEARKKKCPHCDQFQNGDNKIKSEIKMAKNNKTSSNLSLVILMFLLGAGLMYGLFQLNIIPSNESKFTNEYAKVRKINNLYVFVESAPVDPDSYTTIDIVEGSNLIEIWDSLGIGNDKFGKVVNNIFNTGKDNLVFYEKLLRMTEDVYKKHNDASGIIFSENMRKCQVIKFKNK